jgi:hypothetical protein
MLYGYCPLHQPEMRNAPSETVRPQAKFDIGKGVWECIGPDNCNAPKKAGTTTNLRKLIDVVQK